MNKILFTLITLTLALPFTVDVEAKTLLDTIKPNTKNCNYVTNKMYQPFADIDRNFPGADAIGVTTGRDGMPCINVGGTSANTDLIKILFTTAITVIIVLTVINIAWSGIQFMTEEVSGKKGAAKKRLQDSFIALALGLLSYTIMYTVNKQLVEFSFDPTSIDKDGSIARGTADAAAALATPQPISSASAIEALMAPVYQVNNPGYVGAPGGWVNPYGPITGLPPGGIVGAYNQPVGGTGGINGNVNLSYNNGQIICSGLRCKSVQTTVFGFKDGNGQTGFKGDNGIGAPSLSDYNDCVIDNGHEQTLSNPSLATIGVAIPLDLFTKSGLTTYDARKAGIKLIYKENETSAERLIGTYPVVDFSYQKLDLTFGLVKFIIGKYDTVAVALTSGGGWSSSKYSFEIARDYYKYNPKINVTYGLANAASLGTTRPVGGLIPCPKTSPKP